MSVSSDCIIAVAIPDDSSPHRPDLRGMGGGRPSTHELGNAMRPRSMLDRESLTFTASH